MTKPKSASNGKIYLNIGCGNNFWPDWNNLDVIYNKNIVFWNLKKGLPYPDNSIDYVYSSHVLEHLDKEKGEGLIIEIMRVTKPGGIVRLAVPDLEKVCKEYIHNLEEYRKNPTKDNSEKYEWVLIELLDQMTRTKRGGQMKNILDSKDNIREYVIARIGDRAAKKQSKVFENKEFFKKIIKTIKIIITLLKNKNKDVSKELHRWMYDSVSLKTLLRKSGFKSMQVKQFDESDIADWNRYNLDKSKIFSNKPRKPDSLFIEATK